MPPSRLARAWTWHLPGAAVLTVDRIAAALAPSAPDAAPVARSDVATDAATDAANNDANVATELAELLGGMRRRNREIRTSLTAARRALVSGQRAEAAHHVVAARAQAASLGDPARAAWIDLIASMVAVADGALELAATVSLRAERQALAGGDRPTFLAVWWTRAVHALRRGNGNDGLVMARWMRSAVDEAVPALGGWLRCFEAAHHLDDGLAHAAIQTCAPVLAVAPASSAGWAAGRLVTRALLELGRPEEACRVAVATTDHAAGAPDRVRAQCLAGAALALAAGGFDATATRCAALARRLDPRAGADPSAAELDGAGIELLLL